MAYILHNVYVIMYVFFLVSISYLILMNIFIYLHRGVKTYQRYRHLKHSSTMRSHALFERLELYSYIELI